MEKTLRNLTTFLLVCVWASTLQAQLIEGGDDLKVGAKVTINGELYTVGPNLVTNPSFSTVASGVITGWMVGAYANMTTNNFTWHQTGGVKEGAYIQSKAGSGANGANSICQRWRIEPNAKYFMSFWIKGGTANNQYAPVISITNVASTGGGQNEYGTGKTILGKNGEDKSESTYGYANANADGSWAQTKLYFDSDAYTYLQFNARWLGATHGFDEFYVAKLYDSSTSENEILGIELGAYIEHTIYPYQNATMDYVGLMAELDDAVIEYGNIGATAEETQANLDALKEAMSKAQQGVTDAVALKKLIADCVRLINSPKMYPGFDAFYSAYELAVGVSENVTTNFANDYATQLVALNAALKSYRLSQEASENSPADYTFLIQSPWFCNEENTPASNSLEDIAAAKLSSDVRNSTGWVKGSSYSEGDQRLNYTQNRTCWNAWASGYSGYLDIHQVLFGLPSGYYSITCDAITQENCKHDQRAYVSSSTETVFSPAMTIEGWSTGNVTESIWEELNTALTRLVLVNDGNLTIGMRSSRDPASSAGSNGWFCVTNFKLLYHGTATIDALKSVYAAKIAECQAQCDTMVFKGDKAIYQTTINENNNATELEAINTALTNLLAAQKNATISITRQVEVLTGSYKAIQDSIAADVYEGTLATVMQSAVENAGAIIHADGQTSEVRDNLINRIRAYRYDYVNAYKNAMTLLATLTHDSSKEVVAATINGQLEELKATLIETSRMSEMVTAISNALKTAAKNELYQAGGDDYTAAIANPTVSGTSNTAQLEGWTTKYTNGNTISATGQQYDGNTSGRYFDSWNGTAGALLYNTHQTITNIPNGTYTLQAMCRTAGQVGREGTYLYTIADNDSVNGVKLAPVRIERTNVTKATRGQYVAADGSDSILYTSDRFGSIWQAAADATNYGVKGRAIDIAAFEINGNSGRGWFYVTAEAVVTDHILTIGFTNDSTFTRGRKDINGDVCVPFTGTWLSCDNFSLTLNSLGDNTDWSPVTTVATPNEVVNNAVVRVIDGRIVANVPFVAYNTNGQRVDANAVLAKGIYVVKTATSVVKVLVK